MSIKKFAAATAALSLVSAPVFAQSTDRVAPRVQASSVDPDASDLEGRSGIVVAALAAAAVIAGIIIIADDDDEPTSP